MKILLASVFAAVMALPMSSSFAAPPVEPTPDILVTLKMGHPRLMAFAESWKEIQTRRATDPVLDAFLKRQEMEARALIAVPPIPYKKDGKRLLHVSRVILRRVLLLGLQSRLTGDKALVQRAREEMLSAAAFTDWNPSHFLDVGELTLAMALGYDWLHDDLDEGARQTIRAAIVEKGLKPGLGQGVDDAAGNLGWMKAQTNWNQVCLAGLALGALAIAEDEPVLAAQILEKTKRFNPNGLKTYAPDGVYPEGAMYWGYGTTFQTILLDGLRSALGTDWGLGEATGFMQSADALYQTMGPSGAFFNFSDGLERPSLEGGHFWYAHTLKRPDLVSFEKEKLLKYSDLKRPFQPDSEADRTLPLCALWWTGFPQLQVAPLPTAWHGRGHNPLASFRSSWNDPNAAFLALKGGRAAESHGHMDAGSFVFESEGVRWARDLGMQAYLPLETKKVDLWNTRQDGGRWSVFRLNNFSHNTLTVNGQLHQVNGKAEITHFSAGENQGAVVDLSPVFAGQASRVQRAFSFQGQRGVLIRDELEGLKEGDTVRFAMLTRAEITVAADGKSAVLTQNGKRLEVTLSGPQEAKFEVISGEPPPNGYDEPNPGSRFLIANLTAPASGKIDWFVTLHPSSAPNLDRKWGQTEIKDWPQQPTATG